MLAVAESGAVPESPLEEAHAALDRLGDGVHNRATIVFDDRLRTRCAELGLVPLGDVDVGLPLVCFGSDRGAPLETIIEGHRHPHARYFRAENILRFSYAHRGRRTDDPVDCSGDVLDTLTRSDQRRSLP